MSDTTVERAIPDADVEEADTAETTPRHVKTRVDWIIDGAVAFICIGVATAWTFNPLHRQFTGGTFSNYFEGQARAFLDGHLAIDPGVLGIEAFIRDGNEYMYFGPLLGIFRLPQVLLTYSLDGRTTAISLLIGTLVLYWQSIKLLDRVLDLVHPDVEESSTERWFRLGWRASVAAGTVVLTLLAIPWGYHEAHLWSAALFIALLNQILRFDDMTPRRIWIFGLVLLALVLNRPTTAYAGLIGVALLIVVVFVRKSVSRANLTRLSVCFGVALFATVSVNYAKFRRPFGIPMEDQFFTKVDENRAQMLLVNDDKYFQTKFIPSNLWAYFRPNGVDLSTTFPFVSMPRSIPWVWGDAFYDATYRTASVTATNPLLTFASVAGLVMFVKLFRQESFWRLLPAVVAGILAAGGVAGWGYIATRYLTDFLPGMLLLSAIGIAGFVRYVHGRTKPFPVGLKRTAQVGGIALVAWSIVANLAIAFSYSFSVGDSAAGLDRYLAVQDAAAQVIGPSLADRTIVVDSLAYDRLNPTAPGTLAIIGDCEALYLSNGEPVDTWTAVEYGNSDWRRDFTLTPSPDIAPGYELELVRLSESATFDEEAYWFSLVLSVDDVRPEDDEIEYTLSMVDNFGEIRTEELLIPLSEPTDLSITFDENRRVFFVEKDGQNILYGHFDMDPLYDSNEPGIRFPRAGTYGDLTIDQRSVDTPWCDRLLATAGR